MQFAQPLSLVLRGWGDALAWQGKHKEARDVFQRGVERGIWDVAMCRPEVNYATAMPRTADGIQLQAEVAHRHPFVWSDDVALKHFPDVVGRLRSSAAEIVAEWNAATALWAQRGGAPSSIWNDESAGLHSGKRWSQLPLMVNGQFRKSTCDAFFPKLCTLITSITSLRLKNGQVKFSAMKSGTVVRPHAGPSNSRLRAHLTVQLPPRGSADPAELWMRVGTRNVSWAAGGCFVFDESCEHEVVFRTAEKMGPGTGGAKQRDEDIQLQRVVLIVDFANPFLAQEADYVEAHVEAHRAAALREYRRRSSRHTNQRDPNQDDL